MQIKELHVGNVESERGELEAAEEEVVTQFDDNVLLHVIFSDQTCSYCQKLF